jgi:ATP-binding cassette subfamily C protein CydD
MRGAADISISRRRSQRGRSAEILRPDGSADAGRLPAISADPLAHPRHLPQRQIEARLIAVGRSAKRGLYAAIALGFLGALAVIAQAGLLASSVTAIIFRHAPLAAVFPALAGLVGSFALRAGLGWAGEIAAFHAAASVKADLRRALVDHLFRLGPAYTAEEKSADLAATAIDGIEALEPYLARYLPQMALVAMVPLAILVAILPLDWVSGLVLLFAAPIIPLFMVFVGSRAEAINRRQWRQLLRMNAHFLDAVQGIVTLKLFGRARDEIALVARISDDYRRATMAGLRVAFLTSAVLEFFASLGIALVAVLLGVRLLHGAFDFFSAFFVLLLVPEFFLPLRGLAPHYHARMSALAAAGRIFDILDAKPPPSPGHGKPPSGPVSIACWGLSVAAAEGRSVLHHIDCVFPAGKMTAIVGRSGAGKSILAAALLGFRQPRSGVILIDGVIPLAALDRAAWWRQLAYVPQSPRLFAGTIAENLRLARPEATDEALHDALLRARLGAAVERLPAGLATRIGEGGAGLSGGEAQRLALARAFLKDAPLLILDEATAHLDLETEAEIVEAIAELAQHRTAIVIAHRLKTVRRADQILVLAEGRAAESGTHQILLARGGAYAALFGGDPAMAARSCAT